MVVLGGGGGVLMSDVSLYLPHVLERRNVEVCCLLTPALKPALMLPNTLSLSLSHTLSLSLTLSHYLPHVLEGRNVEVEAASRFYTLFLRNGEVSGYGGLESILKVLQGYLARKNQPPPLGPP